MKTLGKERRYWYGVVVCMIVVGAVFGFARLSQRVTYAQSSNYPNPSITVYSAVNAAAYSLSLPSDGPFTNDFKIELCLYNSDESRSLCFTSPSASQSFSGSTQGAWTVAGTGEPTLTTNSGNWSVWGFPGAGGSLVNANGGYATFQVIKGAALPAGEVIDNLKLGLMLGDDNNGSLMGSTLFDDQAASCISGIYDPNSDPTSMGAGYVGGDSYDTTSNQIWSLGARNCDNGFSPDVARMYMSDTVLNAASSSTNIPNAFQPLEATTTGSDAQPIEITVANTGSSAWVSNGATVVPGSQTGTCDGGVVSGFDCPAVTDAPGTSCTASMDYSSSILELKHLSGSFTAGNDPAQYNQVAKTKCTILPAASQSCTLYNTQANATLDCKSSENVCTGQGGAGYCSYQSVNNPDFSPSCNKTANSPSGCSACGGSWISCGGTWMGYATSVISGDPNVEPGATTTVLLKSLKAPLAPGIYTETWQMENGVGDPFGSEIPISIRVGASTSTPGTITVRSENSQNTNIAVPATWNFPEFPLAQDNPCSGHEGSCDNQTNSTYTNLDAGAYQLCGVFDPNYCHPTQVGLYSLDSVKEVPIASRPSNLFTAIANFGKGIVAPDALAVLSCGQVSSIPPSNCLFGASASSLSLTNNPGQSEISYVILWDPIANIAVNSSTDASISLSASSGSSATGQVQVSNSGATGSTLTWSASSNSSWLSASSSSDSSGLTNTAQGVSAAEGITITADASGLSAGPHTGTITFAGTSTPGTSIARLLTTLTVTFTVGASNCQNGVCAYFACVAGSCAATSTPGADSCSNACGGSPSGTLSASCSPASITVAQTSQCVLDLNGVKQTHTTWAVVSGSAGSIGASSGVYTPSSAGTETVSGTSPDGTSAQATIKVSTPPPSPCSAGTCPVCNPSLTATPASIIVPESSDLSYSCQNVTQCELSGGQFNTGTSEFTSGSVTTTPSITTTYTLTCANGSYATSSSATVTVSGSSYCEQNPNGVGCQ